MQKHTSLLAAAAVAMMGTGLDVLPLRTAGSGNNRRPTSPRTDTALAREIAEHNAEVERRKAEKRAAKQPSPSKRLREAGFTRRPSAKSLPSDE